MSLRIHDDRPCLLGEGALWHPEREQLFWFDILNGRLLSRQDGVPLVWELGECASAAGWIDRETLLVATETGLRRLDLVSGVHEPVIALEADRGDTRSNDGRADPMGGFWIGTMGKDAGKGAGTIYRFFRGVIEPLFPAITVPNAICFAPGGRHACFADTARGRIMRQALDAEGWPDGPAEVFADLAAEGLRPDGAVFDAEGGLWNAQWGAGRVARYQPDGRFDRALPVGGHNSSCPAFGGPGLSTLYVTTAREGLVAPDAGQGVVYALDPGARGLPEPRVILPEGRA